MIWKLRLKAGPLYVSQGQSGKDTTTAATLLVVCERQNTPALSLGQYVSEQINKIFQGLSLAPFY